MHGEGVDNARYIDPPQESVMSENYVERGELNPWYFGYQPVSYRLRSRLGTRDELRKMILTCRKQGMCISRGRNNLAL